MRDSVVSHVCETALYLIHGSIPLLEAVAECPLGVVSDVCVFPEGEAFERVLAPR